MLIYETDRSVLKQPGDVPVDMSTLLVNDQFKISTSTPQDSLYGYPDTVYTVNAVPAQHASGVWGVGVE